MGKGLKNYEKFIMHIATHDGNASIENLNKLLPKGITYTAHFYVSTKTKPYHKYFSKNIDGTYSLSDEGKEYYETKLKQEASDNVEIKSRSEPLFINELDLIESLQESHNIILHGAPGTGKTFLAKEIAKKLCGIKTDEELKNSKQFKMVQFHPSYDYTDFVEGLRPRQVKNNIVFKRENGVFKEFCQEAIKTQGKYFVFLIDEINRGDMSKIFGELFYAIDPGYRGEKGKIDTQYQNLIDKKGDDPFKEGFYVPDNVYIIGTMNDIDRSVESMDFAMRRRFQFIEVTAESRAEDMFKDDNGNSLSNAKTAKEIMTNLNNCIISKEIGLSKSYQIGGSYFKKFAANEENAQTLWDYRLKGLLREYLRGEEGKVIDNKLDILHEAYTGENKYNKDGELEA